MNKNMSRWYDRFCNNKKPVKLLPKKPDATALAYVAATLSYRASVLRALKLNGKTDEAKLARQEGERLIVEFLCGVYHSNATVDIDYVSGFWETMRTIYKNHQIDDYTYGNAQKWVHMSIKYYIVLLSRFDIPCSRLVDIPVFPVDRIMINHIKNDLGIAFPGNWSDCDDALSLKQYITDVNNKVRNIRGVSLFEYELNAWES